MRKWMMVVLVAALAALGGSASAQSAATKKIKIGVTMPTADHGWMGGANWWAKKAMDDWKKKDPNVDFIFKTSGDVTKQVADIEDMLVQGVNGLVVFPFESAPVTPVVEKAHEKGVYIVVLDRGVTKPVYDVYLSNDDESYARQAMDWVCKAARRQGQHRPHRGPAQRHQRPAHQDRQGRRGQVPRHQDPRLAAGQLEQGEGHAP